jgi:hypothetical protein
LRWDSNSRGIVVVCALVRRIESGVRALLGAVDYRKRKERSERRRARERQERRKERNGDDGF